MKKKKLKVIIQLNSIEGVKTAVSLGLGAAFMSTSAVGKEIKLKTIKIIKIKDIRISSYLLVVSNPKSYKSKGFELFYNELFRLKETLEN